MNAWTAKCSKAKVPVVTDSIDEADAELKIASVFRVEVSVLESRGGTSRRGIVGEGGRMTGRTRFRNVVGGSRLRSCDDVCGGHDDFESTSCLCKADRKQDH